MRGVLALGVASARRLQGVQASHRLSLASHIVRPSVVVKGARENLGHVVPADQDFPMQAV